MLLNIISLPAVVLFTARINQIIMKTQRKLSREEMKTVTGGKMACACQRTGTAGSWNASYSDSQHAAAANAANCSGGGSCHCTEPAAV